VNAGGTLGGNGNLPGAVVVNHNGAIESGNGNGIGILTMDTLTLGSTAGDRSTFNIFPAAGVPGIFVTGTNGLNANGGAGSATINVGGPAPVIGTYPLIDYNGVLGGGFGAFVMGSLPPRVIGNLSNDTVNTVINLNVTGTDFPVWTGGLNGSWTVATQASPKNWVLNSNSATTTDYINGDTVLFDDSAAGVTTVDISGGNVSPAAVTFDNSTKDYAFTGTSAIAGQTGISKFGTGKLTIGTSNSFTGTMRIGAGTVSVATVANAGVASPLGAGPLALGEATTHGTLEFTGISGTTNRPITLGTGGGTLAVTQAGATLTQGGVLSGDGGLVKSGAGALVLTTNASTFTGNVDVNGGLLTVPAITGSGDTFSALGAKTSTRTITVNDTGELRFTINNVFGGGGMAESQIPALVINQGGTLSATRFNTIGNLTLNGGTLTQAATDGPGAYEGFQFIGTVTVGGTVPSNISTTNGKANHLVGGGNTIFNVADATGTNAPDLIVSAPIANGSGDYGGQGTLTKAGVGTMQISSVSTYNGSTNVNAGKLLVTGSISGSAVSVAADAILGGSGTIGSVQVADGGEIAPGVGIGTLSTGDLVLSSASQVEFELGLPGIVGGTENDLLTISGGLTLDGLLQIVAGNGFGQGTYRLANYSGGLTDGGLALDPAFLASFPGSHIDTATLGEVNLVVVPEPGTALLLLGGVLILGRRRTRAMRASLAS
jgi:fibronectin-binding autotransporter adhesin